MTDPTVPTSPPSPGDRAARPRRRVPPRISARLVVTGLLIAVAVVFLAQNRDRTQIELLSADLFIPLWLALGSMVLLGVVVGYLLGRRR